MNNYQPEDVQWINSLLRQDGEDSKSNIEDILFLDEDDEEAQRFDLISAYIDNEVTVEERKQIQHWLDTDAEIKTLYQKLLGLQTNLKQIPVPVTVAADQLAAQVFQEVDRHRRHKFYVYGGAFLTAMAVVIGSYVISGRNDPMSQMANSTINVTQESEHLMIALNHPIVEIPETEQETGKSDSVLR
jgi:anti-sigma factor RsiW